MTFYKPLSFTWKPFYSVKFANNSALSLSSALANDKQIECNAEIKLNLYELIQLACECSEGKLKTELW